MKLLFYFLIIYLFLVIFVFILQRNLIYFPDVQRPKLSDSHAKDMKEVYIKTADGLSLLSWYKPAQKNKPTIIYLHGNGLNIAARAGIVRPYLDTGYGVLLLSYRGFAGNPGQPSEQGFYQDARAAMDFLTKQSIPLNKIILYGESLGTGVAIQMATEYKVPAVILVAPYSSLIDVGSYHYFYLPVKWLLWDKFDSVSKIKKIHVPILMIHSKNDEVVPIKFSKKLFDAANEPKKNIILEKSRHNDYENQSQEIMKFIDANVH